MSIERLNGKRLELNYMSWNNGDYKFDLICWSEEKPLKGITIKEEEAIKISKSLYNEFKEEDKKEEFVKEAEEEEECIIDFRTFLIHKNNINCLIEGHDIEKVKAIVYVFTNIGTTKAIEVDAIYCRNCKCYYITEYNYRALKEKGHILCQVVSKNQYDTYQQQQFDNKLKVESILHIAGYNLSSGLSDTQRQSILSYVVESGLMSKCEVVNHISFLIRFNESKGIAALASWKKDREFMTGYLEGKTRLIGIKHLVN